MPRYVSVMEESSWRIPTTAAPPVIAGRILALLVLAIVLFAHVGLVLRHELVIDDVQVYGDDATFAAHTPSDDYGDLLHQRSSAILWALVLPAALAGMLVESVAYRRAIAQDRAASFAPIAIALAVLGAVAAGALVTTFDIHDGELDPHLAIGGVATVGAIAVLFTTALFEAVACRRGQRGAVGATPPEMPEARVYQT